MVRQVRSGTMLGGVIFDLDGTLGDTLPVCFAAFRATTVQFLGLEHTEEQLRAMFGPTEEGILASLLPDTSEQALDHFLDGYRSHHHLTPRPFAGIVDVLDRLDARHIPAAVVTGKGGRSARISLDAWGIADRFDRVESGGDHGSIKRERMAAVVAGWEVDPSSVVAVGDAATDITAARRAGVIPVAAAWSPGTDAAALRAGAPDAIFEDVAGFATWLEHR